MAGDIDLLKMYQNNIDFTGFSSVVPGSFHPANHTATGFGSKDDKIDWAKFTMWLKGFLSALEGKPLTPEDTAKIMERLAHVDPDRQLAYNKPHDWFQPVVYPQAPQTPTWVSPNSSGTVTWKDQSQIDLINELYVNALNPNSIKPITATCSNEAALNANA